VAFYLRWGDKGVTSGNEVKVSVRNVSESGVLEGIALLKLLFGHEHSVLVGVDRYHISFVSEGAHSHGGTVVPKHCSRSKLSV
jgi:hypothetical protein